MSTSIDTAFITSYNRKVHDVFQIAGSRLKPAVRFHSGVVGDTDVYQKIGTGVATTKARAGTITPMNQTHAAPSATLVDFYAGDWCDRLDQAKTNIDERDAIARGGAMALGRKVDNQILTALDTTSQTAVTMTVTSFLAVKHAMVRMVGDLVRLGSYEDGRMYGVISPVTWERLMDVDPFQRAEYVGPDGMEFSKAVALGMPTYKYWLGVKWFAHNAVPGVGTATSKFFVWNKDAIGYSAGAAPGNLAGVQANETSVSADITWHGDRHSYFINHVMSGGAVMIDDTGVIEGNTPDTTALATS